MRGATHPAGSTGSAAHSGRGRIRLRLIWDRSRLASRRRRREARVGLVGRRGTAGARACRSTAARCSRAATRLRCWERCSLAVMVRTVPDRRFCRCASTRRRWVSLSALVVARSRLSCTRESVVLTPCPPGPEAWENRSTSSAAGSVRPSGIPGPGGTLRSCTSASMPPPARPGAAGPAQPSRGWTAQSEAVNGGGGQGDGTQVYTGHRYPWRGRTVRRRISASRPVWRILLLVMYLLLVLIVVGYLFPAAALPLGTGQVPLVLLRSEERRVGQGGRARVGREAGTRAE